MKITRRQIKDGEVIANKKVIKPSMQMGGFTGINTAQLVQAIAFNTDNSFDDDPAGVGYVKLSDGTKLNWDGVQFALLDSDDEAAAVFYDANLAEPWALRDYAFPEEVSVTEIAVADRGLGVWPSVTYKYQPPSIMKDFPDHLDDQGNPHKVTAAQTGAYTKTEIDEKQSALINMAYKSGYWYGRRNGSTPWPVPGADTWTPNSRKAFDFSTNTSWVWDGTQWAPGNSLPVVNGTTIGISTEFLDIVDKGYPGKAIYSGEKESWDFYPDRNNTELSIKAAIMPGMPEYSFISDEAVLSLFRRMPADGRSIPVEDYRAERLLQYCLIPHAVAVANPDIIGMYLTNEYYPDHAAWFAANKLRPTPAENGAYLFIPDLCGIFIRGAGKHGGHKAANDTPYDGNAVGDFIGDAIRNMEGAVGWGLDHLFTVATGVFEGVPATRNNEVSSAIANTIPYSSAIFRASKVVPTAHENRPASVAVSVVISY